MSHHHPPEDEGETELNLVPYLDIITNLVIFLVFSFQIVVQLRQLGVQPPGYVDEGGLGDQPMSLTTIIHQAGYRIVGSNDLIGVVEIPLLDGHHDAHRLHDELVRLKRSYSLGENMVVTASPSTEYALIIATMDAAHDHHDALLFPDILLARGG